MRRFKARLLVMLGDVEERRVHLLAAASSMWDYARRFLLMSHGTAYRFIAGARLCKRYPWLVDRIERGELHLTTLAHIASFITDDNVHDLVEETAGKKRADVDLLLRKWFGVDRRQAGNPMPYDAELLRMAERAAELASHMIPMGDRLELTKAAYTVFIAFLEKKTRAKTAAPRPAPTAPTKRISQHATRTMFERDGDQCTYVDERTGARCPSRAFIQREHEKMVVHGGSNDPENLRPHCGPHNLLLAEQALGRALVQRRIHCRQQKQKQKNAKAPQSH